MFMFIFCLRVVTDNFLQMRFSIVEFTEEKTVAVVPNIWIVGGKCYWPPGPGCKMATVQKAKAPNKDWKMYSIVVKTTYSTYQEARRNLDQAQYSDVESEHLQKRKVSKPSRYISDDEVPTFHSRLTGSNGPSTDERMENTCANACDEFHEGGNQLQEVGNQQKGQMSKPSHTFNALLKPPSSFPGPSGSTHRDCDTPAENTEDLSSDSDESEDGCEMLDGQETEAGMRDSAMASPPARAKNRKALTPEEFQHEVLVKLTVLRMVQKQHGNLYMG
ncbi:uncharacterized protein LOC125759619 [Rhipicephalus sanguineus]|uniref:uncharacterized protein LOC125759619 n=1 Tax=Rhipicephalus sanguineus TaxID=34632 RepID=UPI0020C5282A|nr:uncharacterized protein LOC125759619 [Rhipicephalus sanguineus]